MAQRKSSYMSKLERHLEHSYRVHFGVSESEDYHLAVELAKLTNDHQVVQEYVHASNDFQFQFRKKYIPEGFVKHEWNIVEFTDDQLDFMAFFYGIAKKLPEPKVFGTSLSLLEEYINGEIPEQDLELAKRTFELIEFSINSDFPKIQISAVENIRKNIIGRWRNSMKRVESKLFEKGYLDYPTSQTDSVIRNVKQPKNYLSLCQTIKSQISQGLFADAVSTCYEITDGKYFGGMFRELIYLKFLGRIPLTGKDLVHFRTDSDRTDLINNHFDEYILCIDTALSQQAENGRPELLDILAEYVLTISQMVDRVNQRILRKGVFLSSRERSESSNTKIILFAPETFGSGSYRDDKTTKEYKILKGKLFDIYPSFVQHCSIIEAPIEKQHFGLWTEYSPSFFQENITEKGLALAGIEVYRHRNWYGARRKPDFVTLTSLQDMDKKEFVVSQIEYTRRVHAIDGKDFYEVNLLRKNSDEAVILENPFIESLDEILREAENLLREHHGVPRIGEGWVSETTMYQLVKRFFLDAVHHASPEWLKPQHLDVYVPSKAIAFEYQGVQHFEPVKRFGGEESFLSTKERDLRKKKKCEENGIVLIYWHYQEVIDEKTLIAKLKEVNKLP